MKLRTDLLEHLTGEDLRQAAMDSVHRYKPEPLFSKTGVGSLSSASTEERAQEEARSTARLFGTQHKEIRLTRINYQQMLQKAATVR